ncbi:hypothetical protein SCLCIDRAFT_135241 [Scleroderma citrinum Foug A]|uniref:Uncharacterized protein n=1 Tax=Scleroderma citrinum Foug A TaxID=1036808 RepID=A0A0C2ZRF5_9AGAM|nr:hypothetical protein SCLCIDRAFT_135241 [Scleroderma citrinum Foug A]
MDDDFPIVVHAIYLDLLDSLEGTYSLSYDIDSHKTEDTLPFRWDVNHSSAYCELKKALWDGGFQQLQLSDWSCDDTDAADAFWTMLTLGRISPPSKLPTTTKGLKIHHIPDWIYDITEDIQLGNTYYPELSGPAPANLVPPHVPAIIPHEMLALPNHTRNSEEARDVNNWRVAPDEEL